MNAAARRRPPLPRVLRPLRDPALALLWSGLAFSAIGDQVFAVALAWVAVQAFGPAAGYLTALQSAVILAVALLGGIWADRRSHRPLMVAADMARAACLIGLAALWLAVGRPPAWALVVAVVVLAAGQALFRPALQAMLPALAADPARLPAANALLDTTDRIARLAGPALIGLLAAVLPLVHFVSLDALSFLASAAALVAIGRMRAAPRPAGPAAARRGILSSIGHGFVALRPHPLLAYCLLTSGVVMGAWYAALFLGLPLLLAAPTQAAGGGVGGYGAVIASYGATNLLTTLVVGGWPIPRRPATMVLGGVALVGAGVLAMGVVGMLLAGPALLPALCLSAAGGAIGGPLEDIPLAVLRQTKLAAQDLAAATRAFLVTSYGGLLVAFLAAPAVIRAVGVAPAITGCGVAMILSGAIGLPFLRRAES